MTTGLWYAIVLLIMIEWAKAGRGILAKRQNIDPLQKNAMLAQIKAVELSGLAFQETVDFRIAAHPQREPDVVAKIFAALYPDYVDKRFSHDLQVTLAIDSPEAARRSNHNYIGTGHLLLGLLEQGSPAESILRSFGVNKQKARDAVEFILGRGDQTVTEDIGLSPRAKTVVELAIKEARLQQQEVTGEHLLLGIIREGEGIAAGVLESLGVSLHKVQQAVFSAQKERNIG